MIWKLYENAWVRNRVHGKQLLYPRESPHTITLTLFVKKVSFFIEKKLFVIGVRQMQTADLQTRAWVSQARTSVSQTSASVSQTSTPVSQNSTSVRLFRLDGIGNTIYNLPVCSLHMSHTALWWDSKRPKATCKYKNFKISFLCEQLI